MIYNYKVVNSVENEAISWPMSERKLYNLSWDEENDTNGRVNLIILLKID